MSWRARAAAALAALLALALATSAAAKPPLWVVRSHNTTLVLFGSIHLLPPGLDWRPQALDDALAAANEVWFELPIDAATDNAAAAASLRRGALPKGRTLSALLGPADTARLDQIGLALRVPPPALDRMQPWMAELALSIAEDVRAGASAFDGVEEQVQAIAPASARRRAFETADQQIGFLAGAPVAEQIASLDWTLDEIEHDPTSYQRLLGEWMTGDLAGLQRDALDPQQRISPALYRRVISDRNHRWAKLLAARLRKGGLVVVVVGVGHLIGSDGVPALLRAKGLDVEGP
jgi:hypothetical protein